MIQHHLTIDAAVLSEKGKMPLPVCEKVFSAVAKVYLLRWRIEEYFRFKKQQFKLEDLRVMSLKSIRDLNLFEYFKIAGCWT